MPMARTDFYYATRQDRVTDVSSPEPTQQEKLVAQAVVEQYNQAVAENEGTSRGLDFQYSTEETPEGTAVKSSWSYTKPSSPSIAGAVSPNATMTNAEGMKYMGFMGVSGAGGIDPIGVPEAYSRESFYVVPKTALMLDFADSLRSQAKAGSGTSFVGFAGADTSVLGDQGITDTSQTRSNTYTIMGNQIELGAGFLGSFEGFVSPSVPTYWGLVSLDPQVRSQTFSFMSARPNYAVGSALGEITQAGIMGYALGGTESALRLGIPTRADLKSNLYSAKNLFSREPRTVLRGYHELEPTVRVEEFGFPFKEGSGAYQLSRETVTGDIKLSNKVVNVPSRFLEPEGIKVGTRGGKLVTTEKTGTSFARTELEMGDNFMSRSTVKEAVDVRNRRFIGISEQSMMTNQTMKRVNMADWNIVLRDSGQVLKTEAKTAGRLGSADAMKLVQYSGTPSLIIPKFGLDTSSRLRQSDEGATKWVKYDGSGFSVVPKVTVPTAPDTSHIIFLDEAQAPETATGSAYSVIQGTRNPPAPVIDDGGQTPRPPDLIIPTLSKYVPFTDSQEEIAKPVKLGAGKRRYSEFSNPFNASIVAFKLPKFKAPRNMGNLHPPKMHGFKHRRGRR